MQDSQSYAIKVREPNSKRFRFLTPKGSTTRLRIHASCWFERAKAERALELLKSDNPEFEFRMVLF
jgi:hypothetical protein